MALTLQEQFELANEATFYNLVGMAMAGYADDVMAEPQGAMSEAEYNARTSLAAQTITDAIAVAKRRRWWLAAQAAALTWPVGMTAAEFAASVSDTIYEGFVASQWSVLAGYRAPWEATP